MDEIWIIILAAGASTRMKRQKMLLPFKGKTIIESVIQNAALVENSSTMVVLGSHNVEISKQIGHLPVKICINKNYMKGMLSSVICGFQALPKNAKAALIFLGDQPQISGFVANQVVEAWKNSKMGIVIPTFNNRRGHPSLIETKYKKDIENLDHTKGLRNLFQKYKNDIHELEIESPEILRDIDTPENYQFEINKIK